MLEVKLYKFLNENELRWDNDVLHVWLNGDDLKELSEIMSDSHVEDEAFTVHLTYNGQICMDVNELTRNTDLDLEELFGGIR